VPRVAIGLRKDLVEHLVRQRLADRVTSSISACPWRRARRESENCITRAWPVRGGFLTRTTGLGLGCVKTEKVQQRLES
jgi:hypothetical protein